MICCFLNRAFEEWGEEKLEKTPVPVSFAERSVIHAYLRKHPEYDGKVRSWSDVYSPEFRRIVWGCTLKSLVFESNLFVFDGEERIVGFRNKAKKASEAEEKAGMKRAREEKKRDERVKDITHRLCHVCQSFRKKFKQPVVTDLSDRTAEGYIRQLNLMIDALPDKIQLVQEPVRKKAR